MKRAFTLIELLVVLAILGILFAWLFPVFSRRTSAPLGVLCRSNLKQIGLGFQQYSQDHGERLPLIASHAVASSTAPFKTPYGWADALQPYLKSTEIFQCPAEASVARAMRLSLASRTTTSTPILIGYPSISFPARCTPSWAPRETTDATARTRVTTATCCLKPGFRRQCLPRAATWTWRIISSPMATSKLSARSA